MPETKKDECRVNTTVANQGIFFEKKFDEGKPTTLVSSQFVEDFMTNPHGNPYIELAKRYSKGNIDQVLDQVEEVLRYGLEKYGKKDSWKDVPNAKERYYQAYAKRHRPPALKGLKDSESGLPHLGHMFCNLYFLSFFWEQDFVYNKDIHSLGKPMPQAKEYRSYYGANLRPPLTFDSVPLPTYTPYPPYTPYED